MTSALGAARLSRKTDESTSMERQSEQITLTAKIRDADLICITEDTDISGSISPFARDGLGPWLTDPEKIVQWDILIVAKLDRLTRSLKHFDELVEWLDAHGKTLVSVSESLDLSTSTGRMFANLLAMFAQFERERIGERRREAGIKLRELGWWQGGMPPYGYRPVKVESHWELREDPESRGILERIARHVIAGESRRGICRALNADGIPTPKNRGNGWQERTVTLILKRIIETNDPILDDDTKRDLAIALDNTKVGWSKRGDAALLLNVAYCKCGEPLYARRWVNAKSGKLYEYYGCAEKCGLPTIPMLDLEEWIEHLMFPGGLYGELPVWSKVVRGGSSTRALIMKLDRQIDALDKDADDYLDQLSGLVADRKQLRQAETRRVVKTEYEDTGMTVAQYWPTLSQQAQRQFLLIAGVKITEVSRAADGEVDAKLSGPWPIRFVTVEDGLVVENLPAGASNLANLQAHARKEPSPVR